VATGGAQVVVDEVAAIDRAVLFPKCIDGPRDELSCDPLGGGVFLDARSASIPTASAAPVSAPHMPPL
jgi:hypothetical protein